MRPIRELRSLPHSTGASSIARHSHKHLSVVVKELNDYCDVIVVSPGDAVPPDLLHMRWRPLTQEEGL